MSGLINEFLCNIANCIVHRQNTAKLLVLHICELYVEKVSHFTVKSGVGQVKVSYLH